MYVGSVLVRILVFIKYQYSYWYFINTNVGTSTFPTYRICLMSFLENLKKTFGLKYFEFVFINNTVYVGGLENLYCEFCDLCCEFLKCVIFLLSSSILFLN